MVGEILKQFPELQIHEPEPEHLAYLAINYYSRTKPLRIVPANFLTFGGEEVAAFARCEGRTFVLLRHPAERTPKPVTDETLNDLALVIQIIRLVKKHNLVYFTRFIRRTPRWEKEKRKIIKVMGQPYAPNQLYLKLERDWNGEGWLARLTGKELRSYDFPLEDLFNEEKFKEHLRKFATSLLMEGGWV